MLSDSRYYVFNENGTGYCEWRYTYSDSMTSGRVHFAWREASDGGVYLFRTGTEFYDDHTSKSTIPLIKNAIYFGEEFFTYLYSSEVLDMRSVVYLKEGSELKKLVDD